MISLCKLLPLAVVFTAYSLAPLETTFASNQLRTVALTGTNAPGAGAGVSFGVFADPVLNNSGQTAFRGSLTGAGVDSTNDSGIFSEGGGTGVELLARKGNAAPETTAIFSDFQDSLVLNESGQVAFLSTLTGTGVNASNDLTIYSNGGGTGLTLIAREGNSAPGTDVEFSNFVGPFLNDSGQVAFFGVVTGSGVSGVNDAGIFSEGGGSGLGLIARENSAAPGAGAGVVFSTESEVLNGFTAPVLNSNGHTAFYSLLAGTGITPANDGGIFREESGNGLTLAIQEGDPAPGAGAGVSFGGLIHVAQNSSGHIAFDAFLSGPGVDFTNDSAIYSEGGGSGLSIVARNGSSAPGVGAGINFGSFEGFPVLNDSGQTAFRSSLVGPSVNVTNDGAIYSEGGGGGLQLVAREGNQAPDVASGISFDTFFFDPQLNNNGQVAFIGLLKGTGVNSTNDLGLFAQDLSGDLQLIVRTGDSLDVSEAPLSPDLRTVSNLNIFFESTGNADGRRSSFNDRGQLVFSAEFTDGTSGVFLSDLVAEPSVTGDYDLDGDVDGADFLAWQRTDGSAEGLTSWQANYGTATSTLASSSATVPEPSSLMLSLMLGAMICIKRR